MLVHIPRCHMTKRWGSVRLLSYWESLSTKDSSLLPFPTLWDHDCISSELLDDVLLMSLLSFCSHFLCGFLLIYFHLFVLPSRQILFL